MRIYDTSRFTEHNHRLFDRLDDNFAGITQMIDTNQSINANREIRSRLLVAFVILIMTKHKKPTLAEKIILKYWTNIDKSDLLEALFIYGEWKLFQTFWKKNRSELKRSFITVLFRTDELKRTKWLLNHEKFTKYIDEDAVDFLEDVSKHKWTFFNQDAYNLLCNNKEISRVAIEKGYEKLYPTDVKEMFLF